MGAVPSWTGSDIPVPFDVAMEVGRMRRTMDLDIYPGDENAKECVRRFVSSQKGFDVPSDRLVTVEIGDRVVIINACFGTRVNETLSKIISALLSARLGESVGVSTDAYRIVLELPRNPGKDVLAQTLMSIKPESVESLVRLVIRNSSYLRWRFVYVAKKFGIVDKDADHRYMKFSRLFELYEGTPVYHEAVDKVLFEDLDLENTRRLMAWLQDGTVDLQVTAISPMGQQGISQAKELIQPQRADHAILMALKKRLEDEILFMSCLHCRSQVRQRSGDSPARVVCSNCGGEMVAALKGYERESIQLLKKKELSDADRRDIARLSRNANLVRSYGQRAILALSGRGVGPDSASRILQMFQEEEDDFLRDILAAEVNYARTKQFWD